MFDWYSHAHRAQSYDSVTLEDMYQYSGHLAADDDVSFVTSQETSHDAPDSSSSMDSDVDDTYLERQGDGDALLRYPGDTGVDPAPARAQVVARRSDDRVMTVINIDGFVYTRYHGSAVKMSYRCSRYRRKCKAKAHYIIAEMCYIVEGQHVCSRAIPVTTPAVDITTRMQHAVDRRSIEDMSLTPEAIWAEIHDEFCSTGLTDYVQRGLTREQVIRRVHRVRRTHFGSNLHGVVEVPPMSLVSGTQDPFFRFQNAFVSGERLERMIGWAHPELLLRMQNRSTTVFVDGTFRCVPRGFYQCLIFMVFDFATDLFLPVFYVLLTSKTQDIYWNAIGAVINACDEKLDPEMIVCDFESALMNAIQVQFGESASIVGCYFHIKQACRRYMVKLRIPELKINIAMERGVLDALTVIPHDKISGPGISYVKRKIVYICQERLLPYSSEKWVKFWRYFRKTWLKTFRPSSWNVSGIDRKLVSRTNNPLERFNREINSSMTPHPSVPRFVCGIDAISRRYAQRLEDTLKLRSKKRRRMTPESCMLPSTIDLPSDASENEDDSAPADDLSGDDSGVECV